MKYTSTTLLSILLIFFACSTSIAKDINRCSTDEFIAAQKLIDPNYDSMQELWRSQMTPEYIEQYKVGNCPTPTILPIYFHFEQNFQSCIETAMNNQLQVLNEDYLGTNADIADFASISSSFDPNTLGVDGACIQFCLVGSSYGQYSENTQSWPVDVINVFVGDLGYGLLGYAECAGCPANGTTQSRIVINENYFGFNNPGCPVTASPPYNLGRTLTHEMGHFLGLEHTWGNYGGCGNDDGIADTPIQDGPNFGCNTSPPTSCGTPDLFCSFMDYSDDACMYMYSQGQAAAMNAWVSGNLQNAVSYAAGYAACATSQPCPTFVSGSLPDAGFCEGSTANFNDAVDNLVINDIAGGTVFWTADYPWSAGGYIIPGADAIPVDLGECVPAEATVYWNLICNSDSSVVAELGPAIYTAYPDLSLYINVTGDGGCGPSLYIDPECDVEIVNSIDVNGAFPDYTAVSGTGTVFFLISDPDGPGGTLCSELNLPATYDCAVAPVPGCTDPDACNFDQAANYDDGTCIVVDGGTISTADNTTFCVGDGQSDIVNVTVANELGPDYAYVVTDGTATTILAGPDPSGSFDFDGAPPGTCLIWGIAFDANDIDIPTDQVADIVGCFSLSNSISVIREECAVPGCIDPDACNFDAAATEDDGSCDYSCFGCTDPNACNYDMDATVDDSSCDYSCFGCTDQYACNFDPNATVDDGSCLENDCEGVCGGSALAGTACDDGDALTENDVYQTDCSCAGTLIPVEGCTDPFADNYNAAANTDDGSCEYTCYSAAGTVMVNSLCVCEGDAVIADGDDFLLDPWQSVYYVFHTDGDIDENNLPTNIISLGSFLTNDASVTGVVYVTAFGASNDGAGGPNFDDPCLTISNTVAITLLEPIVIYTEEFCDEVKGEFSYTFTVCGGLPEKVPGDLYQITSAFFNGTVAKGDTVTVGPITSNTSYTITASDNNGCTVTVTNDYMCFPVPVTLVDYFGSVEVDGNLLKWITASEIENDYYTLERSTDGVNFSTITQIDGLGTISTQSNYSYLDRDAPAGLSYYRLSQTDFDGTHEILGIVQLTRGESTFEISTIYPLPVNDELSLQFTHISDEDVTVNIYDASGKLHYSDTYAATSGVNTISIETESFSAGVYLLELNTANENVTQKFVKE